MAQVSEFLFDLSSPDFPTFRFIPAQSSLFQRIFFHDNIRDPYPTMELVISDKMGDISEINFFVEGATVEAKLGHLTRGFLAHQFYWDSAQLIDVDRSHVVRGNWFLNFISDFKKQDRVRSASYQGSISDVVNQVLARNTSTGYRLNPRLTRANGTGQTQFVEATANNDMWYQDNLSDMDFFLKLARHAQANGVNSRSPFLTFFNLKGEFFFQTMQQFFTSSGNNIQTYELDASFGAGGYFHDYTIQLLGSDVNFENYNTTTYSIDGKGDYKSSSTNIQSQAISSKDRAQEGGLNGTLVFPMRRADIGSLRSVNFFGIEEAQDSPARMGQMNSRYVETHASYRMNLTMPFNPELCSGRTINLKFKSNFEGDKGYASEYSGRWLIISSNHVYNPILPQTGTNMPVTSVELVKPTVNLWNGHSLVNNLVQVPK